MKGNAINYDNYYTNPSPIWGKSKIDIELKKFLKLLDGKDVLDLGIGEGNNSIPLAELGYNVTGIDYSEKALEICKKSSSNIRLIHDDIRNFNIETNKYDLIMSRNVLHFLHKDDVLNIINNIKFGLKKSGLVYISLFSTEDPSLSFKLNPPHFDVIENNIFYDKATNTYISHFTKDEVLQLFCDFTTVLISDEYIMDLAHGNPHYHGLIKYIGQKL